MTSSCSCSSWPTQLGVRCGLPVSRNVSATQHQSRAGQRGGRGKEGRRTSMTKMEQQISEKKIEWEEADERSRRQEEKREKNLQRIRRTISSAFTESKCNVWFKTIDLNAAAKLGIDFCWCGESKMFVLFHKPIGARRLLSLCAYWRAVCGFSFIVAGRSIKDQ